MSIRLRENTQIRSWLKYLVLRMSIILISILYEGLVFFIRDTSISQSFLYKRRRESEKSLGIHNIVHVTTKQVKYLFLQFPKYILLCALFSNICYLNVFVQILQVGSWMFCRWSYFQTSAANTAAFGDVSFNYYTTLDQDCIFIFGRDSTQHESCSQ